MSYLSLPTSLPYVRDSVNARSITPVNPTRWFLVPDSTPCSVLKTSAVRRGETYPKEAAVILQLWMAIGLLPRSGFLLARNAPGRREAISGLSPQTLLCKVINLHTYVYYWILSDLCFFSPPPRRLLSFIVKFQMERLPPDDSEADGG